MHDMRKSMGTADGGLSLLFSLIKPIYGVVLSLRIFRLLICELDDGGTKGVGFLDDLQPFYFELVCINRVIIKDHGRRCLKWEFI